MNEHELYISYGYIEHVVKAVNADGKFVILNTSCDSVYFNTDNEYGRLDFSSDDFTSFDTIEEAQECIKQIMEFNANGNKARIFDDYQEIREITNDEYLSYLKVAILRPVISNIFAENHLVNGNNTTKVISGFSINENNEINLSLDTKDKAFIFTNNHKDILNLMYINRKSLGIDNYVTYIRRNNKQWDRR